MESIQRIKDSLKEETEEKKEEIYGEAKREIKEIKAEAQRKANSKAQEIIEEGKREADAEAKKILSNARMKARRKKLEFKDEIGKKVFEKAKEELQGLKDEQEKYKKTMENLIENGGISVGGGSLEVLLPKGEDFLSEDRVKEIEEKISSETGKETSLSFLEELDKTTGGVIVRRSDGKMQCNNTFEARLERMKDSLRTEVSKILFQTD